MTRRLPLGWGGGAGVAPFTAGHPASPPGSPPLTAPFNQRG